MSNQKFASKTKFNYSRGLKSLSSQTQLSDIHFRLFSNQPMLNWIENKVKNQIKPTPQEPTYNNKMVGIFSPSTLSIDQLIIDSIKYYWSVDVEFQPFLILEYDGTKEDLIKTLDKAYNLGKRYIFGLTTSSSLEDSLDWLNKHPDVQGVTTKATATELSIPKKIYRTVPDFEILFSLNQFNIFNGVPGNGAIYYIYNSSQLIGDTYKEQLQKYCIEYSVPFIEFEYSTLSELTYVNVQNTIQDIYDNMSTNSYTKSSICIGMTDFAEEFYRLFNSGMADVESLGASYFDMNGFNNIIQTCPDAAQQYFDNILYVTDQDVLNPSKLYYETPNDKKGIFTLEGLNKLYQLENYNGYINQIGIYMASYVLDPITRDNVASPVILLSRYNYQQPEFERLSLLYKYSNGAVFECILP